jgi:hypothetical protein
MTRRNIFFLIFCIILVTFTLFSGCTSESNSVNQEHAVTLHFIDVNRHPLADAHVKIWNNLGVNSSITNSKGDVVFTMQDNISSNIEVTYQGNSTAYTLLPPIGNYREIIFEKSPYPQCNIVSHKSNKIGGQWTVYGYVNNTGSHGTCIITVELFLKVMLQIGRIAYL